MSIRKKNWLDNAIQQFDKNLRAVTGSLISSDRKNPAKAKHNNKLTTNEKKLSAGLMRINHTGEVCAQALYMGQACVTRSTELKNTLQHCADEEVDHLYWCQQRVEEFGSHVSYLNPLWFTGSFTLGVAAGLAGDKWNLGFLAETEHQVEAHLECHLQLLPSADVRSREIVLQMQQDEAQHAKTAENNGAAKLPSPVKFLMNATSRLMTSATFYV